LAVMLAAILLDAPARAEPRGINVAVILIWSG
jgi:hypothetical protein